MQLEDGTVLMHGSAPYDPVKAHQYYLRTRHLKGRRRGHSTPPAPARTQEQTFTVLLRGKSVQLTQRQLAEQKAYADKRVSEITARLQELSAKLRKMLDEAKAKEKPTAAERSKAARRSKLYRKAHKQQLASKARRKRATSHRVSKKRSVAQLKTKITEVRGRLKAAVEIQRALTTATKTTLPKA